MHLETWITFGLALVAYALLQAALAAVLLRRPHAALLRLLFVFALAHAVCVWAFRFGWDLGFALDKGLPPFLAFHGALALMVVLALRAGRGADPWRGRLLVVAWLLVSSSAVVAPFKYPEIHALQIPVVLLTLVGVAILGVAVRRKA